MTGGICQIFCANQLERTIASFCAFKAVMTLEGYTAYIHGGLASIWNILRAVIQILLNAL